MKTPRLSLALLALVLAPFASAADRALPTWKIVEEGHRSWPDVRFSVGNDRRSLECRYSECNPATNKGLSNLYLLTKTEEFTPTTVTIYKAVPRSKWNPAYHYDGPYEMVPEKINAKAYSWKSELSHFKLDNTGGKLFVVQGTNRYPATTDIDETQISGYDQMKVAPPAKMSDDEIKPGVPPAQRSTWWCDQNTGEIIGVLPGQKAPAGYTRLESRSSTCGKKPAGDPAPSRSKLPTAGKWKDSITPVGEWRAIQTSALPILGIPLPVPTMTFFCYHEKMDGDKDLATHLKKHPLIVECVNWSAPTDDATKEEGGKKFKVRNNHVQFDLAFVNGKLKTMSGVKGVTVKEISPLPDALGGEKFVKVTAPQAAPAAGATIALVEEENRWLTKVQAGAYADERAKAADDAARKVVDDKYRALIEAQIRPDGLAAYKAARTAAAAEVVAKTKEAAAKPEMWGGKDAKDVKAVIAPFQEAASPDTAKMLEIQLSKADWELLKKKPEDQLKYTQSRHGANGSSGDGTAFDAKYVDPIALRLGATAARAAVGAPEPGSVTTPGTGKPDEAALLELLTDKDKEFLTQSEIDNYEAILKSAPEPKVKDKNVQAELKKLYAKIEERKGKPYLKEPITEANFDGAAAWQKEKFCNPAKIGGAVANSGPKQTDAVLNADGDVTAVLSAADKKLRDEAAARQKAAAAGASTLPAWAVEKCKGSPFSDPTAANPPNTGGGTGDGRPSVGGVVPTPGNGVDVENKEKEKSKWLTQDLLTSAAKGAMVGLLVGSLFGPVGLIAGPLLGGALFYGLTKITS